MPKATTRKKTVLGRGLGSLLGGAMTGSKSSPAPEPAHPPAASHSATSHLAASQSAANPSPPHSSASQPPTDQPTVEHPPSDHPPAEHPPAEHPAVAHSPADQHSVPHQAFATGAEAGHTGLRSGHPGLEGAQNQSTGVHSKVVETPPLPQTAAASTKNTTPPLPRPAVKAIESSLNPDMDFQEPRVWQIGVEKLKPREDQPRKDFDKEALRQLADSITQQGILQPIIARKKGKNFEIIAGERRWRAAALAGLSQVPVLLRADDSNQKLSELALIENIQREDLNPIEEAEAYQHLMKTYHMDHTAIAEKVGKQRATISNILRLLKLEPELREAMLSGKLSTGQAKVLLSIEDPKLQLQLGRQVMQGSLTVSQTTRLVQRASKTPQQRADFAQIENRLSEELQKTLGTKVRVRYDRGKANVQLRFYSDEELNEFIEKVREVWGN